MFVTIDDDHDGHHDDVFLAGWGSFEASNLVITRDHGGFERRH